MEEKKILDFYEAFAKIIQPCVCDKLFGELVNAMICGHELDSSVECSKELYEYMLTFEILAISNQRLEYRDELTVYPFSIIDEEYYKGVLKSYTIEDIINYRRTLFLNKLAIDIEHNPNSYMYLLVKTCYPSYIEVFNNWIKVKEILRQGWINRRVDPLNIESDAMHSIQMFALASVCMHVYHLDHLDKQKIYEMIIIHEIAESVIGDIVEGTDEHLTKSERERLAVYNIFDSFKNKEYFINLWEEFEYRKSEEAKFVYELDKLDPVLKARYLDKKLNRKDLFDDFYDYEDNRGTFIDTPFQRLFYSNMS